MQKAYIIVISLAIHTVCHAQVLVPPKVIPTNTGAILDFTADTLVINRSKSMSMRSNAVAYDRSGFPVMFYFFPYIYDQNLKPISDTISKGVGNYLVTKKMFVKSLYNDKTHFLFYHEGKSGSWSGPSTLYCTKVEYEGGKVIWSQPTAILSQVTQFSLSSALHENGKDIWIVSHKSDSDSYVSLLLTENGITDSVFSQGLGSPRSVPVHGRNDINISPDGKKVVLVGVETRDRAFDTHFVESSDFDPASGKISNSRIKIMNHPYFDPLYIQFAPDSQSFYVLFETNINDDLPVSLVHFWGYDLQTWERIGFSENRLFTSGIGGMILGPDGKIYGIYYNGGSDYSKSEFVFVIDNPSIYGSARNFNPYFRRTLEDSSIYYAPTILPLLPPFYFRPCSINLPDTVHCQEGGAVRLDATHPLARRYTWSTGDTTASVSLSTQGTYTVRLIGPNCDHTDTVRVVMASCSPTVPNVFTPNSDGQNDRWVLDGLDQAGGWRVDITDRWGRIIYHNPRYDNSWDGSGQPEGIYYYHLHSTRLNHSIRGWISLMR